MNRIQLICLQRALAEKRLLQLLEPKPLDVTPDVPIKPKKKWSALMALLSKSDAANTVTPEAAIAARQRPR